LAGYGATSGDNNLYIGLNAGRNTQGNNNIEVVAAGAGLSILNGSNLLHIGNTIVGDTDARRLAVGLVGAGDFSPDATIEIKPSGTATVGFIVQAAASHTANLTEWQDSSETVLASVAADGAISVSGLLTAATGVTLQRNTPATTTDKLYNVSGSLYFNGSGVGGGTTYTAGSGLQLNGTTFDALTATTSASGITQLQDSATDGTINRAITPNAVYDISGVLAADVASTGTTNAANIATNVANIATNVTNIASTGATNAADISTVSGLIQTYAAGTGLTLVGTEFNTTGTGYFDALGIGTDSPTYLLDVAGDAGFNEYIYHNGDADTYLQFDTDEINFVVGAANMIYMNEGGGGAQADKVTINNDLADVDFQVKGDNDANLFRTDAANDKVGIGTSTPAYKLEVSGSIGAYTGHFDALTFNNSIAEIDSDGDATFRNLTTSGNLHVSGTLTYIDSTTVTIADKQLELASNSGAAISGDAYVDDGGIVLKSTDSDKKWTWLDATDAWHSTENISLASSKSLIFGDSTTQTTSATGDISTVSGLTVTNATNIASTGATNAAAIATNVTNIATNATNIASTGATNAAAAATNATNIATNVTNIASTGATNAAAAATNATNIATNVTNIAATGATNAAAIVTNTTNIASTGATNAADIDTVSGLIQTYTANTGLVLVGNEFNTAGTGHFDSVAIATDGYIYHSGDDNTYMQFGDDQITFYAGNKSMLKLDEDTTDRVIINNGTVDIDLQVKGDNDSNLLRTDAANDRVGIGTDEPAYKLDVDGVGSFESGVVTSGLITAATGVALQRNTPATTTDKLYNVGGALYFNGSAVDGDTTYTANTGLTLVGNEFNTANTGYFDRLGIGTGVLTPTYELDVAGNVGVDEYIYHNGDSNTYMQFGNDQITFFAGNQSMLYFDGDPVELGSVIINNDGTDVDFIVKGDIDSNLLRTVTATDRIGIGTSSPAHKLDVAGTGSFSGVVTSGLITAATGVELQRNTPATTTDKLYNVGGALYFNGSAVDGDTTYTANSGLVLVGTEFNTANTGNFDAVTFTDNHVRMGTIAGVGADGSHLVSIGYGAGEETTGDYRVSIGYQAGSDTKTQFADNGICIGKYAGMEASGSFDMGSNSMIAVGLQAGYQSDGQHGIYIGEHAGNAQSAIFGISLGYYAGSASDGDQAVYLGYIAGYTAVNCDYTIGIGSDAGRASNGNRNIFIGKQAGENCVGSNNIEIVTDGASTSILDDHSNAIHIENTIMGSTDLRRLAVGLVVAGDEAPDATLEIKPSGTATVGVIVQAAESHTASLTEWQNSSETVLASVAADGATSVSGLITAATGVALQRNTPATTTDKLYNVGGALYFNGSAVDGDTTYTAGSGLQLNGTTFDALTATTSASGITQLQDSATDGTTDKAITPNAVYDISGVLGAAILASTYTAGTGLALVGTEFNTAETGHFRALTFDGGVNEQVRLGEGAGGGNFDKQGVFIGYGAGSDVLAGGWYSVFIGNYAGRGATGKDSVMIGNLAGDAGGYGGTGGASVKRVDIGYYAGRLADHDYAICIGPWCGQNMDGDKAIAIGMLAMYYADNCDRSIGIGEDAGRSSNGDRNIFIGTQAGENCVGSHNIEIVTEGASTSILDDHSNAIHIENTIMGSTETRRLAIGKVVAGDEAPDATLEIKPSGTATVGLIIQAESSQTANLTEWQDSSETVLAYVDEDGSLSGNAMTLAGHLAANTKSFLIDHPTKEGKKLQYASLEGPEHGVYVRGYTDVNIISLPDYWTELVDNDSLTVQLTPKDFAQPNLFVSGILDNKVYIQSDGDISAYYTVNAIRKDVDPLEVEI
jgi:hypothetical protein